MQQDRIVKNRNRLNILCVTIWMMIALLINVACDTPISLSISEAKRRALKEIKTLKDTSQIGLTQVMQDSSHHWLVAYNMAQTIPHLFLFLAENAQAISHKVEMPHKQDGKINKVLFEDITHDGALEMLVYLHYDYDISYQGKELLIYQAPFDTGQIREIFAFNLEQVWEHIESFDSVYGVPTHRKRIENHSTVSFFEGNILIKGTIGGREHRMLEYTWDDFNSQFRLVLDENLHEEEEEIAKGNSLEKIKGAKLLLEVTAHEPNCRSFIIEDITGHIIPIAVDIKKALHCSRVTSMSDDGRFLVFTDKKTDQLKLYDFEKSMITVLLENLHAMEGVSAIIWFERKHKSRLAFVGINMDEYEANSRIYIWDFNYKKANWEKRVFTRKVFFECDFYGNCVPQAQYDYRFSKSGNFLYRSQTKGHTTDDFLVLNL